MVEAISGISRNPSPWCRFAANLGIASSNSHEGHGVAEAVTAQYLAPRRLWNINVLLPRRQNYLMIRVSKNAKFSESIALH
jgi:hypothetical protein